MSMTRAEIFQGKDGQWYLRLIAANNENIMSSEGHKNESDVLELWRSHFRDWNLTGGEYESEGGES